MTPGSSPTLTREATLIAYQKHVVARESYLNNADTWGSLADQFAHDATYFDSFYGHHRGRERIRGFLRDSIVGIERWSFPVQWVEIGEGRVVVRLSNRPPGTRPDGSPIEFPSVTIIHYNAAGEIADQMDLYDRLAAIAALSESRMGRPARWVFALSRRARELASRALRAWAARGST